MDGRKMPALLAFYTGLLGEIVIFVMTEFFHHSVDNALVTMLGGLVAIGVANGAMSKDNPAAPPPPMPADIGGTAVPEAPEPPKAPVRKRRR